MQFHDLSKRIFVSTVFLLFLIFILAFSYIPIVKWIIALFIALLGAVGIWEYGILAKLKEKKGLVELSIAIGVFTILGFFITTFNPAYSSLPFIFLSLGIVCLFVYHFDKISGCIESIGKAVLGVCYVAIPLGLALKVLYLYSSCRMGHEGRVWFIYLIAVTKITDTGAYFGGCLFGNRQLTPSISPKKTINGAIIGLLFAILCSLGFSFLSLWISEFYLSISKSLYLGALLGVVGQIGDLAESLLKRDAQVKDSNKLPGFGGVLDLVDSLLFTTPIIYFFLYIC